MSMFLPGYAGCKEAYQELREEGLPVRVPMGEVVYHEPGSVRLNKPGDDIWGGRPNRRDVTDDSMIPDAGGAAE